MTDLAAETVVESEDGVLVDTYVLRPAPEMDEAEAKRYAKAQAAREKAAQAPLAAQATRNGVPGYLRRPLPDMSLDELQKARLHVRSTADRLVSRLSTLDQAASALDAEIVRRFGLNADPNVTAPPMPDLTDADLS